ncbi:LLM class flavin-dependent oxidoreductase [Actinoallomurus sp. CA-150999]|uniref:LLM class flavin-dependent oxidoreductase n=1 Tax=Actinoallomurus sp. CA-150999 TaxID=3239887 RepID=UPI003D8CDA15
MSDMRTCAVSVLETAPVWQGSSPTAALRGALELARRVEALGYLRYWVAEHHNAPFIASCAPPVLAGQIAGVTSTIRVGSGGVMLPNHAPLVVAEQFGTLEALNPGRIDLGIGRSPGTDLTTARALCRISSPPGSDVFPGQVAELVGYFERPGDVVTAETVVAVPAQENRPQIWLLGSSVHSATLAGSLGLPFAFAHHVRPQNAVSAMAAYREAFQPSTWSDRPYAMVAASVIAADSDDHAEWLAGPVGVIIHESLEGRRNRPNLTPGEAAAYRYSEAERARVRKGLSDHLIGGPATVRGRVAELLRATGADELMAITLIQDMDDRVRSYEILADAVACADPESLSGSAGVR